jgi:hypothetical protein
MVDADLDMKGPRIRRSCNMNVLLFFGLTMVLRGHRGPILILCYTIHSLYEFVPTFDK